MILFLSKLIYHDQRKLVFNAKYEFRHVHISTEKKKLFTNKTNQFGTAVLCIPIPYYALFQGKHVFILAFKWLSADVTNLSCFLTICHIETTLADLVKFISFWNAS